MKAPIYLDYQATTPLAPEVAAAMRPWIEEKFGNPHSPHRLGREAAAAIEVARDCILSALFLPPVRFEPGREALAPTSGAGFSTSLEPNGIGGGGHLYFTSGATEAANWALKGAAARLPAGKRRIVTLATEHACVLDTVEWLGRQGFEVDILPVRSDGLVDLDLAAARIGDDTGLVAAMLVNNEIGVVQPVPELARLSHEKGALFFCDAVQGFGRVPLPVDVCDMIAISAHKVHGPKGIGALWVRDGVALDPLLHGGGQEGGLRSGTLSPMLCAGFGEAARLLAARAPEDRAHVGRLWQAAWQRFGNRWVLNGSADARYRGNLNIRLEGVDAARLISEVRQVAFSAGSACASGSGRPSHVLSALGLSERDARTSIRLGFGRYTEEADLLHALDVIIEAAERQRRFAA